MGRNQASNEGDREDMRLRTQILLCDLELEYIKTRRRLTLDAITELNFELESLRESARQLRQRKESLWLRLEEKDPRARSYINPKAQPSVLEGIELKANAESILPILKERLRA